MGELFLFGLEVCEFSGDQFCLVQFLPERAVIILLFLCRFEPFLDGFQLFPGPEDLFPGFAAGFALCCCTCIQVKDILTEGLVPEHQRLVLGMNVYKV